MVRLSRKRKQQVRGMLEKTMREKIEFAVANGADIDPSQVRDELSKIGWSFGKFYDCVRLEEATQSDQGGISVAFVSSDDFLDLALIMGGSQDPSFYDLKDAFFYGVGALGESLICPRDGKPGCALIDYFPRTNRGTCTHFLSWSWGYKVTMMRAALEGWCRKGDLDPTTTFLYCCFFCNNQYRILIAGNGNGSENLEEVFEKRLVDIGRVVALLDTWDEPRYLTHIWTIFEQFTAIKLEIEVTMILPPDAHQSLIAKIEEGSKGINDVTASLQKVDSNNAQAFSLDDLAKVKGFIRKEIGFEMLDQAVALSMVKWVGKAIQDHFEVFVANKIAVVKRGLLGMSPLPARHRCFMIQIIAWSLQSWVPVESQWSWQTIRTP